MLHSPGWWTHDQSVDHAGLHATQPGVVESRPERGSYHATQPGVVEHDQSVDHGSMLHSPGWWSHDQSRDHTYATQPGVVESRPEQRSYRAPCYTAHGVTTRIIPGSMLHSPGWWSHTSRDPGLHVHSPGWWSHDQSVDHTGLHATQPGVVESRPEHGSCRAPCYTARGGGVTTRAWIMPGSMLHSPGWWSHDQSVDHTGLHATQPGVVESRPEHGSYRLHAPARGGGVTTRAWIIPGSMLHSPGWWSHDQSVDHTGSMLQPGVVESRPEHGSCRAPCYTARGGGVTTRAWIIPGPMLHSPGWWSHDQSVDHTGLHATQPGVVESRPERGSYRAPCYTARGGGVTTRAWIIPAPCSSPGWWSHDQSMDHAGLHATQPGVVESRPKHGSYRAPCYTARGGGVTTSVDHTGRATQPWSHDQSVDHTGLHATQPGVVESRPEHGSYRAPCYTARGGVTTRAWIMELHSQGWWSHDQSVDHTGLHATQPGVWSHDQSMDHTGSMLHSPGWWLHQPGVLHSPGWWTHTRAWIIPGSMLPARGGGVTTRGARAPCYTARGGGVTPERGSYRAPCYTARGGGVTTRAWIIPGSMLHSPGWWSHDQSVDHTGLHATQPGVVESTTQPGVGESRPEHGSCPAPCSSPGWWSHDQSVDHTGLHATQPGVVESRPERGSYRAPCYTARGGGVTTSMDHTGLHATQHGVTTRAWIHATQPGVGESRPERGSPCYTARGGGVTTRAWIIPGSMLHSPGWWSHDQHGSCRACYTDRGSCRAPCYTARGGGVTTSVDHAGLHATQPGVVESRPERGSYRAPCYTARGGGVTTRAWIIPGSMLHSPGWWSHDQSVDHTGLHATQPGVVESRPERGSYRAPCYTARGGGVTTRAWIIPGSMLQPGVVESRPKHGSYRAPCYTARGGGLTTSAWGLHATQPGVVESRPERGSCRAPPQPGVVQSAWMPGSMLHSPGWWSHDQSMIMPGSMLHSPGWWSHDQSMDHTGSMLQPGVVDSRPERGSYRAPCYTARGGGVTTRAWIIPAPCSSLGWWSHDQSMDHTGLHATQPGVVESRPERGRAPCYTAGWWTHTRAWIIPGSMLHSPGWWSHDQSMDHTGLHATQPGVVESRPAWIMPGVLHSPWSHDQAWIIPGSMLHSPGWWSHDQSVDHTGLHATQPGVVESRPEHGSCRAPCYTARGGGVTTRVVIPGSMLHSPGWWSHDQSGSYRAPCYTARGGGVTTRAWIIPGSMLPARGGGVTTVDHTGLHATQPGVVESRPEHGSCRAPCYTARGGGHDQSVDHTGLHATQPGVVESRPERGPARRLPAVHTRRHG